jgi:uncharacterized protein (DUF2147 family)
LNFLRSAFVKKQGSAYSQKVSFMSPKPFFSPFLPALFLLCLLKSVPAHAEGPQGIWLNEAGTLRIRIAPCGAALCGTIVWLREPGADIYNPDPAKREQPLLGSRLLSGMMSSDKQNEWKGAAYNPLDGRTYAEVMSMQDEKLLTQGCVNDGAICHSSTWTKVN